MKSSSFQACAGVSRLPLLALIGHGLLACSGGSPTLGEPKQAPSNGGGGGFSPGTAGASSGGLSIDGSIAGGGVICDSATDTDDDHDGYTITQGDCNDCDPVVNPGAFDVAGNQVDEDCSGVADDEPGDCDSGLDVAGDALAAAKAVGVCRQTTKDAVGKARTWGLISARYVFPDGSTKSTPYVGIDDCDPGEPPNDKSHGILGSFGPNVKPVQGHALAVLSSGVARAEHEAASLGDGIMCTHSKPPSGLPVSSYSTCGDLPTAPDAENAFDGMALELVLRAPTNANGFAFDFDFYTSEYPAFVCFDFDDTFAALLYSANAEVPVNHNIAFDSGNNPVSVNNAFVEVCDPYTYQGTRAGKPFTRAFTCPLGASELVGAAGLAATGWLQTRASVNPGEELTLRFAIWDTGDSVLDATVLLDRFVWDAKAGSVQTVRDPVVK